MNKVKGNMYEDISHTWNPLGGKCFHDCKYCSTNKIRRYPAIDAKYSGEPRLVEKEMKTNLQSGNTIFVVGQNDLFAQNVKSEDIKSVLDHCRKHKNNYLFQTKNPERFIEFIGEFPDHSELCITLETNRYYKVFMNESPSPAKRVMYFSQIKEVSKTITIEPIMDFDLCDFLEMIKKCNPNKVYIGADSGKNGMYEPSPDKIELLIENLKTLTNVVIKDNLKRILK